VFLRTRAAPNIALHLTASSVRSCVGLPLPCFFHCKVIARFLYTRREGHFYRHNVHRNSVHKSTSRLRGGLEVFGRYTHEITV
jgi:hypothetical protein